MSLRVGGLSAVRVLVTGLLVCLWVSGSASAQQAAPRIGIVDLATLIMFHPTMASYDPFGKSFARQGDAKAGRGDAVAQEAAKRRAGEAKAKADELRSQLRLAEGRLAESRQKYDRLLQELDGAFRARLSGLSKAQLTQEQSLHQSKRTQLDQKRAAEVRGLELERTRLTDAVAELDSYGEAGTLMGPTQTNQTFLAMLGDIRRVTAQVAARRGIEVVLDASSSGFRGLTADSPEPGFSGRSPLAALMNQGVHPGIVRDAPALKGQMAMQVEMAASWYQNRAFVLGPFRQHLFSSFVVTGGIDLTQEVLVAILSEQGVPQHVQTVIVQALRGGM